MKISYIPASQRGHVHQDWLQAWYSFSFADWYDPAFTNFGALRVLNDDIIAPSNGFGWHPHRDMEIVTVVLSGTLSHRDNTGGEGEIRSGDIQVMSAGTGVMHMEYNHNDSEPVHSLQLWFFTREQGIPPRYDQAHLPVRSGSQRLLVSGDGTEGSLQIAQDVHIVRMKVPAGESMTYTPLGEGFGQYCFLIEGKGSIGGQQVGRRDAVAITGSSSPLLCESKDQELDILILDVPITVYGV